MAASKKPKPSADFDMPTLFGNDDPALQNAAVPETIIASKTPDFFDEQQEHSELKTRMVVNYFKTWATALKAHAKRYAYIDPYAGRGTYKDGAPSTPLLILQAIIENPHLSGVVETYFGEMNHGRFEALREAIETLPGYETLALKPHVQQLELDSSGLPDGMRPKGDIPTLLFADPCGYKGLSIDLIYSVIRRWGCDCIFFFNYDGIRRALGYPAARAGLDAIFGHDTVTELQETLDALPVKQREIALLSALEAALARIGGRTIRFRVRRPNRHVHYLVGVSTSWLGYKLLREVMGNLSTAFPQGVPTFEYDPFRPEVEQISMLSDDESRPLDKLEAMLLEHYAGRPPIRVAQLFQEHSAGRLYLEKNYKQALKNLFEAGTIICKKPDGSKIRKNTMPDEVLVSFPQTAVLSDLRALGSGNAS